jgi:hypothetical protein
MPTASRVEMLHHGPKDDAFSAFGAGRKTVARPTTSDATTSGSYIIQTQPAYQAPVRTAEQIAEETQRRMAQLKADQLASAEREAKRQAAKAKAEQLLVEHLTEEQEQAWKENRAIFVTAKSGRRFKIREGRAGTIEEINAEGKAIRSFCVHVEPHNVPDADNVLAQKLALEHNEEALLRMANNHPITPYR